MLGIVSKPHVGRAENAGHLKLTGCRPMCSRNGAGRLLDQSHQRPGLDHPRRDNHHLRPLHLFLPRPDVNGHLRPVSIRAKVFHHLVSHTACIFHGKRNEAHQGKQRRLLLPDRLQHQLHKTQPPKPPRQPRPTRLDRIRRPRLGRLHGHPVQRLHDLLLQPSLRRRHHGCEPYRALRHHGSQLHRPGGRVLAQSGVQAELGAVDGG